MKIDIFNHIYPPAFHKRMGELVDDPPLLKRNSGVPVLADIEERFRVMDLFGDDYRQVLSLVSPPVERMGPPQVGTELARLANDGIAEIVAKYPDRFPGWVATVSMNDMDSAMKELERSVEQLGALGVQIFTNVNERPLDEPEFYQLFEWMAKRDLPIWLHPTRTADFPDYQTEDKSLYEIWWTFGWPYETSVTMARLVFSKIMERLPNLKIITHHMGGMIPYFEGRVGPGWDQLGTRTLFADYVALRESLKKRPVEYFRDFYADTALFGARAGTVCGLDFFGFDKVLFASDFPFSPEGGRMYIRETIKVIDGLDITDAQRQQIYEGNARKLLKGLKA